MRIFGVLLVLTLVGVSAPAGAVPTAEALFDEGQTAYDRGDYVTAIDRWQASYRLSREPALIFNIAQAHRLAGDCTQALWNYRRFNALDPTSERRSIVDVITRDLEVKCGAVPRDEEERAGSTLRFGGLASAGVGVALVTTGLLIGHHGSVLGDEVTRACAVSCDWTAQRDRDTAGRRDATVGRVLDVAGIVTLVGGGVLYYLGAHAGTVAISPRDGGATISWSAAW